MSKKVRFLLSLLSAFAMLAIFLMQYGCEKQFGRDADKDFASSMQGEWDVTYFSEDITKVSITYQGDSLVYHTYTSEHNFTAYSVSDPLICTLPEMENMGKWKITGKKDELNLETQDLCGNIKNYTISYSNCNYISHTSFGVTYNTDDIEADVQLIGSVNTVPLSGFRLTKSSEPNTIDFAVDENERYEYFTLTRR